MKKIICLVLVVMAVPLFVFAQTLMPPTGLTVEPGDKCARLSWDAYGEEGAYLYWLYISVDGVKFTRLLDRGFGENTATITNLKNGATYYFTVTVTDARGRYKESAYSTIPSVVPKGPVEAGEGAVAMSWGQTAGPEIAGFNIYMSEEYNGPFVKVNGSPVKGASYIVKGLKVKAKYYFSMTTVSKDIPPKESVKSKVVYLISVPLGELE